MTERATQDDLAPIGARSRRPPREIQRRLLWSTVHVVGLLPLAWLIFDFWFGLLGPDPIRAMILRTGKAAIIMLTLSLACTPAETIFGWKQMLTLRRPLGLYAFFYACLHLIIFIWLDYGFRMRLVVDEIIRLYAVVGFVAFLLLVPLAATSSKGAQRRLGKRWKSLHKLVYLAGVLAVIHYLWLVKNAYTQPLIFAAIIAFLLLIRVDPIRRFFLTTRRRVENRRRSIGTQR